MSAELPSGTEVLRIRRAEEVLQLSDWVHDAYLEDRIQFSPDSGRAVIPFLQESGWGDLHPSLPDPHLVKKTFFAWHYHVPLTRCYIVIEQARSLETDIEWGCPDLLAAEYSDSTFRLTSGYETPAVAVRVAALDIRVLASPEVGRWLHRKMLRGLRVESDRPLSARLPRPYSVTDR